MRLGDDVLAKGKKGVVVKIVSGAMGIVEVGVYLKPWSQWNEEWAKGWIPKVHMFSPADITQAAANLPPNMQCPECGGVRQYILKSDRFACVNGHRQKFSPAAGL